MGVQKKFRFVSNKVILLTETRSRKLHSPIFIQTFLNFFQKRKEEKEGRKKKERTQ